MAKLFVIQVPVADLRREPLHLLNHDYSHQELRETQLLFGERVELLEERGEWLKVTALEQSEFRHDWIHYPGWIHRSEAKAVDRFIKATHVICAPYAQIGSLTLSYGTLLTEAAARSKKIPKNPDRDQIVEEARQFVGVPYLWGGRAFPLQSAISSVDCSGLINLLYRAQGVTLPRNAHAQYLKCRPTVPLLPGDPLYLAKETRMSHVVLKLDSKTFIESPETGKFVRLLNWGEEIWEEGGRIHIFDRPYSYRPHPGSFIAT